MRKKQSLLLFIVIYQDYFMAIKQLIITIPLILAGSQGFAGPTTDAALGGAIGGATGAAIGHELGGRDGAILGGALGGATGAVIASDREKKHRRTIYHRSNPDYDYHEHREPRRHYRESTAYEYRNRDRGHKRGHFCPPGQRKKGNC